MEKNRIKQLREAKNIGVKALSEKLNIPQSTLTRYETNFIKKGKMPIWQKLADFFGVSVGYIQGISDFKNPFESNNAEELWNNTLGYMSDVGSQQYDQEHQQHEIKKNTVLLKPILDVLTEQELADIDYDKEIVGDAKRSEFYQTINNLAELYRLQSSQAEKELTILNENLEQKVMMANRPSELGGYDNDLSDKE